MSATAEADERVTDAPGGGPINMEDAGAVVGGRRGEVGGVNLFPIMPPVTASDGEFVAASSMFMTRQRGRHAGRAGGGLESIPGV